MTDPKKLPSRFAAAVESLQRASPDSKKENDRKAIAKAEPAGEPINKRQHLQITRDRSKTEDRQLADVVTDGVALNAATVMRFTAQDHGNQSLTEMVNSLAANGQAVNRGDLASLEKMLTAQAISLNAVFTELARRASLNMGTHLEATETYMRLALRAQSQSRATVESLSAIKNPPVVFAKQANINNGGQQQVNNGANAETDPAHTVENEFPKPKLLEQQHAERMDAGAPSSPGRANQELETVGVVNRAPKRGGKSRGVA